MKACFILQRNFAYIGHSLASILKEKYGVHDVCGYVYLRSSYDFLVAQKDIQYTKLLLDSEIHDRYKTATLDRAFLTKFEQDYGTPSAWPFLALDRVLMFNQLVREYPYDTPHYTHEDMLKLLQVHAQATLDFLATERPDVIVFSVIGGLASMMLYHVAKKQGIRTIIIHPACMKHRYVLTEEYSHFTGVNAVFATRCAEKTSDQYASAAKIYLDEFRAAPHPYYIDSSPNAQPVTRKKQFQFLEPKRFIHTIGLVASYFKNHFTSNNRLEYDYIHPWNYLKDAARRKLRNLIGTNDLYDAIATEDFAFFPLHYEPEITTLLYAPYYTNQLNLIRQIAKSLPVQYKLYVKEHPGMVVYRPRSFYTELKKIPNVKLINPSITSFELLKHTKLVITITSTTGWEACLLGRPVVTFGNVFYNALPFVKHVKEIEALPRIIQEQLADFRYDESTLLHFIAAMLEESTEVNLQHLWEREQDMAKKKAGLVPLADLIAKKLRLTAKPDGLAV